MTQADIIRWLWEASIGAGIITLVLLILRKAFAGRIKAQFFYCAWLLVALRLLMPPGITSPLSVFSAAPVPQALNQSAVYEAPQSTDPDGALPSTSITIPARPAQQETAAPRAALSPVIIVWLSGIAAAALVMLIANIRLRRAIKAHKEAALDGEALALYESVCKKLNCRKLPIIVSRIASPCLVGVIRPYIVITPRAVINGALEYVYLHELMHYKQRDPIWGILRLVCCALFWFNPFIWIAARASRTDCELACDARVIRSIDEARRMDYAMALLKLIQPRRTSAITLVESSTAMSASKKAMKERIELLINRPKTLVIAALCAAILLACAACSALGATAVPTVKPDGITAAASATPQTVPTPTPETDSRFAEYESFFPDSFGNMKQSDVDAVLTYFNGDFTGVGRTDGTNSYILLSLSPGVEFPSEISIATVSYGEGSAELFQISSYDENYNETPLYTLPCSVAAVPYIDIQSGTDYTIVSAVHIDAKTGTGYVVLAGSDPLLSYVLDDHYRPLVAYGASYGLSLLEPSNGAYITFRLYNAQLADLTADPLMFYLPITSEQLAQAKSLATGAEVKQNSLGVGLDLSLVDDDTVWSLYENGFITTLKPDYTVGARFRSDELKAWLYDTIEDATGLDRRIEGLGWLDEGKLESATLSFWSRSTNGYVTQTISDSAKLETLRSMFTSSKMAYASSCPFNAPLVLRRDDGAELTIFIACDSCSMAMPEGKYFVEYKSQLKLLELFNQLPMPY
jgi:beta-lactamase regulating signal transducer with metallopeptidase domain